MKKSALLCFSAAVLFVTLSCDLFTLGSKPPTPTPQPTETATPTPTATPVPPTATPTPPPTDTPTPTDVPKVRIAEFEEALEEAGYTPYSSESGNVTYWVLDNWFETINTYRSGKAELQVLNRLDSRLPHMEQKLSIMDGLFPSKFMSQLREANNAYAETVGAGVTGKPTNPYGPDPNDPMQFQMAYYNVSEQEIGAYDVQFSLLFMQWTCPPGYVCSFPSFGNREFTGQASFVFYEIAIWMKR